MHWSPGDETLLVLNQIGYPRILLKKAKESYLELSEKYPNFYIKTDQDFVAHLRVKWFKESILIEGKYRKLKFWIPSKEEYQVMEQEGYWKEAIDNQLSEFIFSINNIAISRFGLFKHYLKKQIPLHDISLSTWYPSKALIGIVLTELFIHESDYDLFFSNFLEVAGRKEVDGYLLPKFFFNFIKTNKLIISEKSLARKRMLRYQKIFQNRSFAPLRKAM